jgi:hypothetical protein
VNNTDIDKATGFELDTRMSFFTGYKTVVVTMREKCKGESSLHSVPQSRFAQDVSPLGMLSEC